MFSFDHGSGITQALVDSFAALVRSAKDQAFVLIPHDFRPVFGDLPTLEAVIAAMAPEARERVWVIKDIKDPAELKGFVGGLDGVLTGRMHLAIAAMGQGIPVAGVTYQGKFEGLLRHFEIGEGLTIAPPDAANPDRLIPFFKHWLKGLEQEAASISAHLPHVTALSMLNFS
jgi:polysaccharide pyruvyl transferase WcaK-like protein